MKNNDENNQELQFWMYDWKVQNLKVVSGFKLDGHINLEDAEAAALLLIHSQRTGYALKINAELVKLDEKGLEL